MYHQAQEILLALRQQGGLHDGSGGFHRLAGDYPWYPTAWLGLCMEDPDNTAALEKAALHIHHPLRLQWLTQASAAPMAASGMESSLPAAATTAPLQPEEPDVPVPDDTMPQETAAPPVEPAAPTAAEATMAEEAAAAGTEALTTEAATDQEESPAPVTENVPAAVADTDDSGAEEALLFQPYYTVDYFASQGIKVEGMLQQTNRFDRQLMSFTQWLKTMKKLNYEGQNKSSDPAVDAQATASVVPKEVVTEAMAEVLLKQGKLDQAIALYAKLTLLHPEKSVFFATQIQKIKEQQ